MAASFQGFRSLIENSPDAISLIDTQCEILYGSPSTTKLFGYLPEELVGRNCLDLIHPEDRDHSNRTIQEVLYKPPGPLQWDARVRCKDGNYCWVESTVSNLLFESEVQAMVVHQRDINARRTAEREQQEHAEELVRSNLRLEEFCVHRGARFTGAAQGNFVVYGNAGEENTNGREYQPDGQVHRRWRGAHVHSG
jgi:PAS domain S-box-containing protein